MLFIMHVVSNKSSVEKWYACFIFHVHMCMHIHSYTYTY